MNIRKDNNEIKRKFLQEWVKPKSNVLDVGCGQGGDVHKWRNIGVILTGIDPSDTAIQEAKRRSCGFGNYMTGFIYDAPIDMYDVICYNFSLQYQPIEYMNEITNRLKPGGLLIGVVTDPNRIHLAHMYGIQVKKVNPDTISVYIPDTPYYSNGPVEEPLFKKHEYLKRFNCISWVEFSIYAKFVFQVIV